MAFSSIRNPLDPSSEAGHAVPYQIIPGTMPRIPLPLANLNQWDQSSIAHDSINNLGEHPSSSLCRTLNSSSIRKPLDPSPEDGYAVPYQMIPETIPKNPLTIANLNQWNQSSIAHVSKDYLGEPISSNQFRTEYSSSIRRPLDMSSEDSHAVPYQIMQETMPKVPLPIWNMSNRNLSPKRYITYHNLDDHVSSNRNQILYLCHLCKMSFDSLSCTEMLAHSCEEPYQLIGDRTFYESGALENGVGSRSVSEIFECNVCQKAFSTQNGLMIHMQMHTQRKIYRCEICGEGFSEIHDWKLHLRYHAAEKSRKKLEFV